MLEVEGRPNVVDCRSVAVASMATRLTFDRSSTDPIALQSSREGAMNRPALFWSRFAGYVFLSTSLAVVIPVLVLLFFAEPVADDFARAIVADVSRYVQWTYSHWTGRWAALGFQALLFSRLPLLSIYPAILLGLQLVQFLAVLAFWHTLLGSAVSLRARLG
jgi:hypothetical protein